MVSTIALQAMSWGSIPHDSTVLVAQMAEQLIVGEQVMGSSPI